MFDPYHKWLGIPEDQRPPTHYQLLGVWPSEADPEVIEEMALRQTAHVRNYQTGPHAAACTRLLNEIARARAVLLHPARRRAYDAGLRAAEATQHQPAVAVATAVAVCEAPPVDQFEALTEPARPRRRRRRRPPPFAALTGVLVLALTTVGLAVWGRVIPGPPPSTPAALGPDTRKAPDSRPATGEVRRFGGGLPPVHAVAFSPDGRSALSGGGDLAARPTPEAFALRLWDVGGGRELRRFSGHEAPVWCVAFSDDGRFALSGAGAFSRGLGEVAPVDCTVRLWDVDSSDEVQRFAGHTGPVRGVAFLPGGYALSCGGDGTVRAWQVRTGREAGRLEAPVPLRCLAVTPDGACVLAGGEDGVARLWRLRDGRELARFDHGDGPVTGVAVAPDGRRVLTAGCWPRPGAPAKQSMEWYLRLWDVGTGAEVCAFPAHTQPIRGLSFSPDSRRAVSGAFDGGVRLWDVAAGREARGLAAHRAAVGGVAFSPEGGRVLSGAADGTLCLWMLPPAASAAARR
jgi:WD40 repeat protein